MKITALLVISFSLTSLAYGSVSHGFLHLWMKDGKFEKMQYLHGQLDIGAVLIKSKLMDVTVHNGESFLEYRAQTKDGLITINDKVGFGSSSLALDLHSITDMFHADYYYKNFKWQLYGPSIDSLYNVLAELDAVDDENVIEKTFNEQNDAAYSVGTEKGDIACYVDHGGNGGPIKNPPLKTCVFTEI